MASKSNQHSLAIIIPVFNEGKIIAKTIEEAIKELRKVKIPTSLIMVNDGSSDATSNVLTEKQKAYKKNLIVLTHKKNKGYGAALQTGITYAIKQNYEFYLTMDSDLTNPPKYIHDFVKKMSRNIDCVKASRYIKGSKVIDVSTFRVFVSKAGNYVASLLFGVGVKDCTNGFKMVRLELLRGIKFQENNFSIILEELYYLKKRKAKFAEIPNVLYARTNTKSHFRYTPKIFYDYFKYGIKAFLLNFGINT